MDEGGVSSLVFHVDSHKLHLSQEPLQNGNLDTRGPLSRRGLVSSLFSLIFLRLMELLQEEEEEEKEESRLCRGELRVEFRGLMFGAWKAKTGNINEPINCDTFH